MANLIRQRAGQYSITARHRDQRFSSASELATAFEAAVAGQAPVANADELINPGLLIESGPAPRFARKPTRPRGDSTARVVQSNRTGLWIIGIVVGVLALIGSSMMPLSGKSM